MTDPDIVSGDEVADEALTIADYEEVLADKRRLTKELDDAIFGEGGATRPAMCDVLSSVRRECRERGVTHLMAAVPHSGDLSAMPNPTAWFFAANFESEWWSRGGDNREETVLAARAHHGQAPFYIVEAKRLTPTIESMRFFDGDDIVERMQDDEAWGEDGWDGAGDTTDLERRLNETVKQWFAETCSLDGAQLDFVHGPERIEPEVSA